MVADGTGRILVVDDDATVAEVVARYLERDGHVVDRAVDGLTALHLAESRGPDLVVLDLMLPRLGGYEVCARLRDIAPIPIIMLTARGDETDRVAGLQLGADDYVAKPFSARELALRVQAVLRRARAAAAPAEPEVLVDGDLVVDIGAHEVCRGGRLLALTGREFDLLGYLMRHPREAHGRAVLLERVWGWTFGDQSTVTVHVRRLREKIEQDPARPQRLVTVWGVGYRYEPEGGADDSVG